MATSFSGGGSRSTWREPPTMDKQLVNFITCESSAPFLKFTKILSIKYGMQKLCCISRTYFLFTCQMPYMLYLSGIGWTSLVSLLLSIIFCLFPSRYQSTFVIVMTCLQTTSSVMVRGNPALALSISSQILLNSLSFAVKRKKILCHRIHNNLKILILLSLPCRCLTLLATFK